MTKSFRLAALMRLRENRRAECRQDVAAAQAVSQGIALRIAELDEAFAALRSRAEAAGRPGPVDIDHLREAQQYQTGLQTDRSQADRQLQSANLEVDESLAVLVEADRDLEVLEKLRQIHETRTHELERRREQAALDEWGGRQRAAD